MKQKNRRNKSLFHLIGEDFSDIINNGRKSEIYFYKEYFEKLYLQNWKNMVV